MERSRIQEPLAETLKASGVTGGLVVYLGCGDGRRMTAMFPGGAGDSFTVQGLDADARNVEAAREHIRSRGTYGRLSVHQWSAGGLPYVDNLVNVVVAEDLGRVSRDEVLRVLAPLGVAYWKQGERWTKIVKPWPAEIDQWQQHFHDADNNAVAHDAVVGPPRHYQWISQPQWTRSHLTLPSINCLVSSRGRLFTVEDQGSAEHPALPGKFALVARDAFNGITLWEHPFPDWQPVNIYIKFTPAQLQRRLAASGDTIYCTPGLSAAVTVLDAATGKAMVLAGDVLFVAGTPVEFAADDLAKADEGRMGGVLWVASAATGEKLAEYKLDAAPVRDGMAAAGGRLYIATSDGRVVCLGP